MKEHAMNYRTHFLALLVPVLLLSVGCPSSLLAPSAAISAIGDAPTPPPADADAGGGDGGVGDGGVAPTPTGECAVITAPISGHVGTPIAVSGACSSDPQGLAISYGWAVMDSPPGSGATIADSTRVTPSFVPDVPGSYRLRLVVSNGTLTSDPMDVDLEVDDCGIRAPEATPSATPAAPNTGAIVQLDVATTDADTDASCAAHAASYTWSWSFISMPAGSAASLSNPSARTPSFSADMPGDYLVRVVSTDPTGRASAPAELTISASDCGNAIPSIDGLTASPTDAPAVGQTVQLTSSISDADTDAACAAHAPVYSYAWSFDALPAGSGATLNDASAQDPSFTPDVPGIYTLRLRATDPTGRSSESTLDITANTCGTNAPTATVAAAPTSTHPGEGVQLQGAGSDADNEAACGLGQRLFYDWHFIELPAGSLSRIVSPTAERPSFVPDMPGDYVAALVVTDDTGLRSDAMRIRITADACGLAEPIAAAAKLGPGGVVACTGGTATVNLGATQELQFDATGSTDPDNGGSCGMNQTLFYDWQIMSTPLRGGRANFRNPNARQPTLNVQVDGTYEIRLIVSDETGRQSRPVTCRVDATNVG